MGRRALLCKYNNPLHDDKNLNCCDGNNRTKRIMMEHSRIIEVNMSSMMKDRILWRFFFFSFSSSTVSTASIVDPNRFSFLLSVFGFDF